jgi:hypothetical protein
MITSALIALLQPVLLLSPLDRINGTVHNALHRRRFTVLWVFANHRLKNHLLESSVATAGDS